MIKKIIILIISLFIVGGVGLVTYNKTNNTEHSKKETEVKKNKTKCIPFTGGSFNIIFNTDGGVEIPNMGVCIACSPDSYEDLPTPVKDGSTFDGWYYDSEFNKKVEITNSKDITPVPKYDKNKCVIGHKDINLYAKWSEVQPRVIEDNTNNSSRSASTSGSNGGSFTTDSGVTTNTPNEVISNTRVYKPSDMGFVIDGYGYKFGHAISYLKIKNSTNGLLYPINDADVVAWTFTGDSNQYKYVLYKTVIDGKEYYVMYFTYSNLIPIGDTYETGKRFRKVSWRDPLVRLSNNPSSIDNFGMYRIKIAPIFSNDYNYVVRTMFSSNMNITLNPSMFLGIYEGDTFYER